MNKRVILVTGGNRGIGLAIVKELAQSANDLILLGCRDIESGGKIAREIGENVKAVELRLANREELSKNIQAILDEFSRVDVLINNAGVLNEGTFLDVDIDRFDEALRVNAISVYELIRAFVPAMKDNGYGRIVNVSSGWGAFEDGLSGPFTYSLSKATLNALTLSIAKDLPKEIKINSMCPGWVRTRMGGKMASRSPEEGAQSAVWLANLDSSGPTGGFFRDKRLISW